MFAPAKMSEVDIFVFEDDVDDVAQTVARLGVMHLLDVNSLGKWAEGVGSAWAGQISTYATQERRVQELLAQLGIEGLPHPYEGKLNPAEDLTSVEQELQEVESSTQGLREREVTLRHDLEHWDLVSKSMEILAPLSISIADLRHLEYLHLVAGTIPAENLARLEASLFRIPYTIIPVYHYGRRVLVFAFCAGEHAPILERALESAFLDPLALPEEFGGTGQEVLAQVSQHIQGLRQNLAEVEAERKVLAGQIAPRLLAMLTRVRGDRAIAEAMSHFGHRGRVYLIAGWVPKDKVTELRAAVENVAAGRVTIEENSPFLPTLPLHTGCREQSWQNMPGERRKVPTLLRNIKLLQPMEGLVSTYGVPGYREIDPTLLVAVSFVLMFGIMFGDLGQGLALVAMGLLLVLRVIPQLAAQAGAGRILVACGLSASVFGLLYGSFFGLEDVVPSLWLKPMHDIWKLLGAAIAFGVVVLNIGFGCRLATAIREDQFKEAIFDKNGIAGLLLYWCLGGVTLLVALRRPVPTWLDAATAVLFIVLFAAEPLTNLISGKQPLVHGNIVEYLVQAFFELFEALISYVSNTLSYVRLGAFAVAHNGLNMVVLQLARMFGSGPSAEILQLLIIVLGNIVIVCFEGLIVGIQTLRLEYYEFFGKFFKGEGIPFQPLTLPEVQYQPRGAADVLHPADILHPLEADAFHPRS